MGGVREPCGQSQFALVLARDIRTHFHDRRLSSEGPPAGQDLTAISVASDFAVKA